MKLHIVKRSGKYLGALDLPEDTTADDLKSAFYKTYHYYPERQRYTIDSVKGPVLKEGSLAANGVTDGTTLCFKDLGVQISWRLVFVLEYLGPIIIMPLFWCFPPLFYKDEDVKAMNGRTTTQIVALTLFMFHFLKREVETLFVHRFSNATMPIMRLPINCAHYWLLCGASVGYFLCHPKYRAPYGDCRFVIYPLATLFLVCEILNFRTHHILRQLRPRGTKARGIPQGCGFQWVSCANYMWETAAWSVFCVLTMCFTSYLFTVVAFGQMLIWALKKHKNYRTNFPDYPRCDVLLGTRAAVPGPDARWSRF